MRSTSLSLSVVVILIAAGCAHPQLADTGQTVVLSLSKLDCMTRGSEVMARLRTVPGVRDVQFDVRRAEVTIAVQPGTSPEVLLEAARSVGAGIEPSIGAGKGSYQPAEEFPPAADFKLVARADEEAPDLGSLRVANKVTLVEFCAVWWGPCHELERHLKTLLLANRELAVRKIEISDWQSPAARRHLKTVAILPYVVVLDRDGSEAGRHVGRKLEDLDGMLKPLFASTAAPQPTVEAPPVTAPAAAEPAAPVAAPATPEKKAAPKRKKAKR